ncbi:MAG TPA: RlmE family RNA methyltransferase [Candidatus Cybelea sp.]|nr:RlmE family RNA methyltransferase [Candidatus Cybelea sp.]
MVQKKGGGPKGGPRQPDMTRGGRGQRGAGLSGRGLTERVKTAHKRTASSTRWLERQLNDPYVAEAKKRGFRSRAAFKLLQLDERFHFLKPGARVVDLGAAPGGWSQVAAERVLKSGKGKMVGIDILEMEPLPGVSLLHLDFMADEAPEKLKALLEGEADVVLSDMAAPATGHQRTDHLKIVALAETAYAFAAEVLAPGGTFIAKVLQGGATGDLLKALKRDFAELRHVKPPASRKDSAEIYVVALGFRGQHRAS